MIFKQKTLPEQTKVCSGSFLSAAKSVYIPSFTNGYFAVCGGNTETMYFIDSIFEFIRSNNEKYRLLCRSNDFLFAAKKLTAIASGKLLELCLNDSRIKQRAHIELDLEIFLEGLLCEYVKYCRGYSDKTLDDLYEYTKYWVTNFIALRSA